jgi:hypothetical protein
MDTKSTFCYQLSEKSHGGVVVSFDKISDLPN